MKSITDCFGFWLLCGLEGALLTYYIATRINALHRKNVAKRNKKKAFKAKKKVVMAQIRKAN